MKRLALVLMLLAGCKAEEPTVTPEGNPFPARLVRVSRTASFGLSDIAVYRDKETGQEFVVAERMNGGVALMLLSAREKEGK